MSKVITFSRKFPGGHASAGEPTHFVEKIWAAIGEARFDKVPDCDRGKFGPKSHTTRAGRRFKPGDVFSPRVWSGTPYKSPQVIIARDLPVVSTWDIELYIREEVAVLNGHTVIYKYDDLIKKLARNDGLTLREFRSWFREPFSGQVICWSPYISYDDFLLSIHKVC